MISVYRGDVAETMQKAPSTNIQPLEKLQVANTNPAIFGCWSLRFLWSLGLGIWMF
jgi:hypothetical protein